MEHLPSLVYCCHNYFKSICFRGGIVYCYALRECRSLLHGQSAVLWVPLRAVPKLFSGDPVVAGYSGWLRNYPQPKLDYANDISKTTNCNPLLVDNKLVIARIEHICILTEIQGVYFVLPKSVPCLLYLHTSTAKWKHNARIAHPRTDRRAKSNPKISHKLNFPVSLEIILGFLDQWGWYRSQ